MSKVRTTKRQLTEGEIEEKAKEYVAFLKQPRRVSPSPRKMNEIRKFLKRKEVREALADD